MASEVKMLKYLPATFGLAVLLIASTALAEERSAQKQFVNHNDSMMVLQVGHALGGVSTLEREGWTPTFGRGCEFEEFVWNHNSRLTFEPIYASAPLPPRDIGGLRMPLGWVYAGYVTCADYGCNSLSVQVR